MHGHHHQRAYHGTSAAFAAFAVNCRMIGVGGLKVEENDRGWGFESGGFKMELGLSGVGL